MINIWNLVNVFFKQAKKKKKKIWTACRRSLLKFNRIKILLASFSKKKKKKKKKKKRKKKKKKGILQAKIK